MAADERDIKKTMRTRLATVTGVPDDNMTAWEGRTFDPPEPRGTVGPQPIWLREVNRMLDETLAASDTNQAIGETLYLVNTPKGKGTKDADDLCLAIAQAFRPGQGLAGDVHAISLEKTERRPYRQNPLYPAWQYKTVAIRWRVHTSNSGA